MEDTELDIAIVPAPAGLLVTVGGAIDMSTAGRFRSVLDEGCDGHSHIVVDLTAVSFMDSSGLHVLVDRALRQQLLDGRVELSGASEQVRRLLGSDATHRHAPASVT